MLGKNGVGHERQTAYEANPNAFSTKRDFSKAIKAVMNGEIQGDHYGVQVNMKLEGSTISFRREQAATDMIGDNLLAQHPKLYFAHLSDDGTQICEMSCYISTKQVAYLQECKYYDSNIWYGRASTT